jgi:hypothetical protein
LARGGETGLAAPRAGCAEPVMTPRGTTRTPGADPTRLPLGLDPRAISLAEGVRAGLATALPVAAAVWLKQPLFSLAALGALLTCICDPGGPLRRRAPILLAFVGIGAALLGGMGVVRAAGIPATLLLAFPALLASGFLRVWGPAAQALGNLLAVVLLLGTDDPLRPAQALHVAALFGAGGAWASLLALALWRIHPFGPARRAVADVWHALAGLARQLLGLLEAEAAAAKAGGAPHAQAAWDAGWDSQARAGRGAVRAAIERARATLMDTMDQRDAVGGHAAQDLVRLQAADQLFAVLIALSDRLEHADAPARAAAIALLRRLGAMLRVLADATGRERLRHPARMDRAIASMAQDAQACPALAPLAQAAAERLRVVTRLIEPAPYLPGGRPQGDAGVPLRARLAAPAAANWTWRSASLRHAVRVAVVTTAALGATLLRHGPYTHWLTITLVLVMQPFFATTWQRTLERVGGTLLGGAAAAGLAALPHARLHLAALLPLLGAAALAVRQVSYGVYIAVYTPVVILLVEQIRPQEDQTSIALARAGYTVLGGLIAVVANLLLWPAWQPEQVRRDLAATIAAHAAYARAVLLPTGADPGRERRQAGLASNNLEASLQRALHEPRRGQRDRLAAILVADATLRRIAGRLAAISLDAAALPHPDLRAWAVDALHALATASPIPPRPASHPDAESLDRLARQIELLAFTIARDA